RGHRHAVGRWRTATGERVCRNTGRASALTDGIKASSLKPREVVKRLKALGFVQVRQRGAHKQFRHTDGRGTTVPFHKGQDISTVLLKKIADDIGMTAEEFVAVV